MLNAQKNEMIFQKKSVDESVKNVNLCFFSPSSDSKAIINRLKTKMAPVISFEHFFERNPNFFSQIGKEVNPFGSITLEFRNIIEVHWKNRFTLHDFKEGSCISDERIKGLKDPSVFGRVRAYEIKGKHVTSWPLLNA